ncbi:non-homologous end-joining factor 1 isoform X2 [Polyodon spathula]|uniref:non-homologous end-joining factor 1 isoform X2 n=1 Tax=Polyodon spathula TaxID=7913 RepID=UPI001B7EE6D6|nr:non-homologous end-joining factor 1 isoform X2 [Polyodon spathula]
MEVFGDSVEAPLDQPWVPLDIADTPFLAKVHFGDTAYQLLLSDLHSVWHEEADAKTIGERSQELNRRLKAPVSSFFRQLCVVARPKLEVGVSEDSKAVFSYERTPERLSLRVKSELAGVPFYWEFRCTPATVTIVCRHLVHPLLTMCQVLQRQTQDLMGLLGRKDAEIQDYQENGATLSRGRLETAVFREQDFKKLFLSERLPEVCAVQACRGFSREIQELYTAVTTLGCHRKRKHPGGESASVVPNQELNCPSPAVVEGKQEREVISFAVTKARQEEDTVPPTLEAASPCPVPPERPSTRPKKKKAKGLFR